MAEKEPEKERESERESELAKGLESAGRIVEGLAARVLGPKSVGKETVPETPTVSPEVDQAISELGHTVGRYLHAAGEGLKEHPTDLIEAGRAAQDHVQDPVTAPDGWSPLVGGALTLGEGLLKVTEGVLDVVAPRKK